MSTGESGQWTCPTCNFVNEARRKKCGGRKLEDSSKFCAKWNPLAPRRRKANNQAPATPIINNVNAVIAPMPPLINTNTNSASNSIGIVSGRSLTLELDRVQNTLETVTGLDAHEGERILNEGEDHTGETTVTDNYPLRALFINVGNDVSRQGAFSNTAGTNPVGDNMPINAHESSSESENEAEHNPFSDMSSLTPDANARAIIPRPQPSPNIQSNLQYIGREFQNNLENEDLLHDAIESEQEHPGGDSDVENPDSLAALFENLTTSDDAEESHVNDNNEQLIQGSPDDWRPPGIPIEWRPVQYDSVPMFDTIDNPGDWPNFAFRSKMDKRRNYKYHCLATGVTPVPKNREGKRMQNGYEFFYQGWRSNETGVDYRHSNREEYINNAKKYEIPDERKGCLDADKLKKYGLDKNRIQNRDALFFYQLLLPLCDAEKSGIVDDKRKSYYSACETYSNIYASKIKAISSYGHSFSPVLLEDNVHFDGVIVRDGCVGGGDGDLYRRWDTCSSKYDEEIANSLTFTRFLQIKRVKKSNNNYVTPPRGDATFDPAHKFDLVYECMVKNLEEVTNKATLDQTVDESSWGHGGYGEKGTGIVTDIINKPGISRGGQVVICMDSDRLRPRAYLHRHKLHPVHENFTKGQNEIKLIMDKLDALVDRNIFTNKPHLVADNFFSGDKILHYAGGKGYGFLCTTRRDRLGGGIARKYFHHEKTTTTDRSKFSRYLHPVVAVKTFPSTTSTTKYQVVHTSFQSTSSCNISSVNSLGVVKLYVRKKERGSGTNKRVWAIEMNDARCMYLGMYNAVDVLDHYIKNSHQYFRTWKYWHMGDLHGKIMIQVVAWDMYLECCEGAIEPDWFVEPKDRMDWWSFRDTLGLQLLRYKASNNMYPGDSFLRSSTRTPRNRRNLMTSIDSVSLSIPSEIDNEQSTSKISINQLKEASAPINRRHKPRLCGNLDNLESHVKSVIKGLSNDGICNACGLPCFSKCGICNVYLHYFPQRGQVVDQLCFLKHHNESFFGIARQDMTLVGKRLRDFKKPNQQCIQINTKHIKKLRESEKRREQLEHARNS